MSLSTLAFMLIITLVFIGLAVLGIFWALRSGQYDDLEKAKYHIFLEDEVLPNSQKKDVPRHRHK